MKLHIVWGLLMFSGTAFAVASSGCGHPCGDTGTCDKPGSGTSTSTGGSTASAGAAGGGSGGMAGAGGSAPCGGSCKDPTPLCDKMSNKCVACLADGDCKTADAAHCDMGACMKCTASAQCAGHTGTTACDTGSGKCVECKLGEEMACSGGKTCDLTTDKCVAVAAGSVKNCVACSNDVQCQDGACIPLDFNKQPHGYFCLKAANPACQQQPFDIFVNKQSISGKAATKYCGVDEDQTTCEAVLALVNAWACSGAPGKCINPMTMQEVDVPGALCKTVGVPNKCTYACNAVQQCLAGPPANTCGDGKGGITGWCGG